MAIEHSENWFLRKHESGEVFGPVPFEKIREWAHSAQVNAQDMLSTDQIIWTKAPMIPETEMDWLIVVGENVLYGPTTVEALLEFERLGEITTCDHFDQLHDRRTDDFGRSALLPRAAGDQWRSNLRWTLWSFSPAEAQAFGSVFSKGFVNSRTLCSTKVAS